MTAPVVGPGIAKRMAQYGTSPATAEDYRPSPTNWTYTEAFGLDARRYVYLKATNEVLVFDPVSTIVSGGGPDPAPPTPAITQIPSPNCWPTRDGHKPIAIVLHTMDGTIAGSDAWFTNPASQVSAHYGVGLSGEIHQYVPLEGAAWANGVLEAGNTWPGPAGVNPNLLTSSVETEDLKNPAQPVTEAQYNGTLACCRIALARYPSIRYLLRHGVISPKSRPNCPGDRWVQGGGFASLGKTLGLETR